MKKIAILGATGSIGTQALDICARHPDRYRVTALTARANREKLFEQVRRFRPEVAGLTDGIRPEEIPEDLKFCRWVSGKEALRVAAAEAEADQVLVAVVGIAGLESVMNALEAGRQVLLANKEALVTGGHLVTDLAKKKGLPLLPVDSEHSAIFQCLQAAGPNRPTRILLTASGGPFRTWEKARILSATREEALRHPNWSMGAKITVDSASMFNKGLEIMEARWLFDMPEDQITVVVHPESIVHSAVAFEDGAVLAQLGVPDMRIPIQLALTYPNRMESPSQNLDLLTCGSLTFQPPDPVNFPCLAYAVEAAEQGGGACAVLNGANEAAVGLFLQDRVGFCDIPRLVRHAMDTVLVPEKPDLEQILSLDRQARDAVLENLS